MSLCGVGWFGLWAFGWVGMRAAMVFCGCLNASCCLLDFLVACVWGGFPALGCLLVCGYLRGGLG